MPEEEKPEQPEPEKIDADVHIPVREDEERKEERDDYAGPKKQAK